MTEKKARGIAIKLWTWLAKTGKEDKTEWPGWEKYGRMENDCPLCEYGLRKRKVDEPICHYCTYMEVFGGCMSGKTQYYVLWSEAETPEERKKYAKLFLEQLKTL